jgi:hypothetical protein
MSSANTLSLSLPGSVLCRDLISEHLEISRWSEGTRVESSRAGPRMKFVWSKMMVTTWLTCPRGEWSWQPGLGETISQPCLRPAKRMAERTRQVSERTERGVPPLRQQGSGGANRPEHLRLNPVCFGVRNWGISFQPPDVQSRKLRWAAGRALPDKKNSCESKWPNCTCALG